MADPILTKQTSLSSEDVVTQAVQFFTTSSWRATTQSARAATFEGSPPIPWVLLVLTFIGFLFCIVPGVIMYFCFIVELRKLQNIVVATTPKNHITEVTITHPSRISGLVKQFLSTLPDVPEHQKL